MDKLTTLINTDEFVNITYQDLSLVAFDIPWSSPCRSQQKILVRLIRSYGDSMAFARVDVENHPQIAEKNNIQTVPTLIIYQNSREVKRLVGLQSLSALQRVLQELGCSDGAADSNN